MDPRLVPRQVAGGGDCRPPLGGRPERFAADQVDDLARILVQLADQEVDPVEQAAKLEASSSVPPGAPWELVLLSIPGLLVESFWLRQSGGDGFTDLVVPYDTPPQPLDEMHVYQRDVFLDIVRILAQERISELAALPPPGH